MEPVKEQIMFITTVKDAGPGYDMEARQPANYYLDILHSRLWLPQRTSLRPGDRVRITIIKEPS